MSTITSTTLLRTWVQDNASIYITYPLESQNAVGPLAAALIAGLVRQILANPPGKRVLFAIDEMPTVALPNLTGYLATVGGAGITMILYAQALPQIEGRVRPRGCFEHPQQLHKPAVLSATRAANGCADQQRVRLQIGGDPPDHVRLNQLRQSLPARDGGRGGDVLAGG
jgi:hypothetical protein